MKKIDKSYLVIGVLFVLALGYKFLLKPKKVELPKYGNYLSCIGHPFDLKIKVKSSVYLAQKGMPDEEKQKQDLYFGASVYQNFYAFGNLLDQNPNSPLKWSSFTTELPKIKVVSVEETTYPFNVEFEKTQDLVSMPPEGTRYLTKILPYGSIAKGEKAVKVNYEMESNIQTCFMENSPESFKQLKVFQPLDPYMNYFVVPISQRRLIKNPIRHAEGVYNPCMRPDGITASGYNPFSMWLFWKPEASGHGADKQPFDCSLYYQEGKTIQMAKVDIEENVPRKAEFFNFKHFENMNRPIKMSVLVGGQESKIFTKLDKADVNKFVDLYLSGIDYQTVRNELPQKYDAHFVKILILLWKVRSHMEIFSREVTSDDLSVNILLRGKLKLSKKDVELRISLSPNSPLYAGNEIFAKNFNNDFLTNDIVVYEGHAYAGGIFDEGLKLLKQQNYANQDKTIGYQIFAIYSCSSSFYYEAKQFPKIENANFKRDIVRTAGSYLDSSGNGSLALIASLDQYLYNEAYVPFAYWAKNFKSDNFYILSNH
jgi:hypothetical protein